jgi:hypothetical protein
VGGGAVGQLGRGGRPSGQGLVQAELVADDHGGGKPGGAEVVDEPAHQLVQLGLIDRHEILLVERDRLYLSVER